MWPAPVLMMVALVLCLVGGVLYLAGCSSGSLVNTSLGKATVPSATSQPDPTSAASSPLSSAPSTSAPSPTSTSLATSAPPLTVSASGDVMGDRGVGQFIAQHGGPALFTQVKTLFQVSDIGFVNLETPVSTRGTRNTQKSVTFRSPPALVQGLSAGHINVVSLANNHALDYGAVALADTFHYLDTAHIAHAGAGANLSAARAPAILDTPAGKVAVLAFTDIIPAGFSATATRAGLSPTRPDQTAMLNAIRSAAREAKYVIVSFHWGIEYTDQANAEQRSLAHAAIDAGADLVLGAHPHVLQGLELYRGKLIAYSLGDFVFDHYSQATGETVVLQVKLSPAGKPSVTCVPVYLNAATGVPAPVTGKEANNILTRLTAISAPLGVHLVRSGSTAVFNGGA